MRGWAFFFVMFTACGSSTTTGGGDVASGAPDVWTPDTRDATGDSGEDASSTCQVGGTCKKQTEFGQCSGTVSACENGQPICDAPAPTAETCNQKDDDCNGITDDNLCEDGDPCTTGVCVGVKCAQKPLCDDGDACTTDSCTAGTCSHGSGSGCTIGGTCIAAGSKDPQDACKVCNPLQSRTSYVAQKGLTCDDGDACTSDDACTDGKCVGTPIDCGNQSDACGTATCVNGKCVKAGGAAACTPGDIATCAEPCEQNVCGKDCQWQGCALKAGATCAWKSGTNHQCCGKGGWQFCSKATCNWYACQVDPQSGCP